MRAALALAEARGLPGEAELALARAMASDDKALIAHQRLRIAKLERQAQLIDQMELELKEHEASASADELAAELAASRTTQVSAFVRRRPETRTTFPEHLPRERVIIDPPSACECCGRARLRKLGEDVTRTLEPIPRRWKGSRRCGRRSPAATARGSARPRRPSTVRPYVRLSRSGSPYTASSRVARSGRADPHRRRTSLGALYSSLRRD